MSTLPPPPNVLVKVFEQQSLWVDSGWIARVAAATLDSTEKSGQCLSIVITDDETVAELNKTHRGLDETTDVLAFSYTRSGAYYGSEEQDSEPEAAVDFILPPEVEPDLGEIVVSYPQAERQAFQFGHSVKKELAVLLAHGILHLLGYDHEERAETAEMRDLEGKVLAAVVAGGLL